MHSMPAEQHEEHRQDWAHYTDMAVGDILRRTRTYYNLRIEDVEGALRIRASQLMALEDGQVEKLPGRVYAIGFVRAYAEFLGLDGDKMVHLFKAQLVGSKARPELNFPVPASESKVPSRFIMVISLAGLIALGGAAFVMRTVPAGRAIPAVPAEVADSSAQAAAQPAVAGQAAAVAPGVPVMGPFVPDSRIVITVLDSAWVEIRNAEGKPLISRILKPGDSYIVPNETGLVMDTGNVGVLEFAVDGVSGMRIGAEGDVRRNVALNPAGLRAEALNAIEPAAKAAGGE